MQVRTVPAASPTPTTLQSGWRMAEREWQQYGKDTRDIGLLEAFKEKHKADPLYVRLAEERIEELKNQRVATAPNSDNSNTKQIKTICGTLCLSNEQWSAVKAGRSRPWWRAGTPFDCSGDGRCEMTDKFHTRCRRVCSVPGSHWEIIGRNGTIHGNWVLR
jgi:hypothetical protein